MTDIGQEKLVDKNRINKPTYAESVIQGLNEIHSNPYKRDLDRHVQVVLPNSLSTEKGTEAYTFLKKAGALGRNKESGVVVELSKGLPFKNKKTNELELTLVLDFKYTEHYNEQIVSSSLS